MSPSLRFGPTAKTVVAAFALALILFLELCAASPALHCRLHADGDRANTSASCVVCALASGQLGWSGTIPVTAIACIVILYITSPKAPPLISVQDLFSLPTRGPPLA
jgi:hypothetical protein